MDIDNNGSRCARAHNPNEWMDLITLYACLIHLILYTTTIYYLLLSLLLLSIFYLEILFLILPALFSLQGIIGITWTMKYELGTLGEI